MSGHWRAAALLLALSTLAACVTEDTTFKVKSRVEFTATVDHFAPAAEHPLAAIEPVKR